MKDIMIKIVGKQVTENNEESKIEFVTEGRIFKKGTSMYIIYEETELAGLEGCTTSLKINGDQVKLKRYAESKGGEDTTIFFQKGKRFESVYNTAAGPLELEVLTNELSIDFDEELLKGKIDIDYDISIRGLFDGRSFLNVEVM